MISQVDLIKKQDEWDVTADCMSACFHLTWTSLTASLTHWNRNVSHSHFYFSNTPTQLMAGQQSEKTSDRKVTFRPKGKRLSLEVLMWFSNASPDLQIRGRSNSAHREGVISSLLLIGGIHVIPTFLLISLDLTTLHETTCFMHDKMYLLWQM